MSDAKATKVLDHAGDYATVSVPEQERKGFASILWINAGYTINLGCIFGGAALASILPLNQAFIALAISAVIQAAIAVPIGAIGAKYGLSSAMLSREPYGKYGSWLIALTLALSLGIGWFGWQVALFADTIHALAPNTFLTSRTVACIWGGGLMVLTATVGFKAMGVLSFIAVPMMLTFFGYGTVTALVQSSVPFSQLLTLAPASMGTIGQGVTMAVGITAAGAIGMADITRYAKSPRQAGISGTLGYLGGALFCECAGALIIVVSKLLLGNATSNLIEAMLGLGLGVGCLIMLILAQWTTNDNNLYSGALGLTSMLNIKKPTACVIMGALGIVIALAGIQDYFVPFLTTLGLLVPPMGGVLLSHYLIVRPSWKRDSASSLGETFPGLNFVALIATIGAAAISHFWVIAVPPPLVGVVSALLIYAVVTAVLDNLGIRYKVGEHTREDLAC